jgi:hypothetical protein
MPPTSAQEILSNASSFSEISPSPPVTQMPPTSAQEIKVNKMSPTSAPFFAICLTGQHKLPWTTFSNHIHDRIFKSIGPENAHIFAASDSSTEVMVSMRSMFGGSFIDGMPFPIEAPNWRSAAGDAKSGWPEYSGICPDGYHSSAYSIPQYMHWDLCLRMIKRQEQLQGWKYDLIVKWRVDRNPTGEFPHASDPRWNEIADTDYYSQGINQPSTPLNIPFDQWFVIRRNSAQVIMSDFIDTMLNCIKIEEMMSLVSERNWNCYLWNESKLAYHIHKAGMRLKWGLFAMGMA